MEKYIQPFVDVCENVFKEFIGSELVAERPHFADKNDAHDWDVSAIIGLTGEARGAVVISMKQDLAFKLTGILTGNEHKTLDDEVVDAIGEIINIIAGNAKRGLEESFRLVISLPTIVRARATASVGRTSRPASSASPSRFSTPTRSASPWRSKPRAESDMAEKKQNSSST
jgi:chemotaxis protein CheX